MCIIYFSCKIINYLSLASSCHDWFWAVFHQFSLSATQSTSLQTCFTQLSFSILAFLWMPFVGFTRHSYMRKLEMQGNQWPGITFHQCQWIHVPSFSHLNPQLWHGVHKSSQNVLGSLKALVTYQNGHAYLHWFYLFSNLPAIPPFCFLGLFTR